MSSMRERSTPALARACAPATRSTCSPKRCLETPAASAAVRGAPVAAMQTRMAVTTASLLREAPEAVGKRGSRRSGAFQSLPKCAFSRAAYPSTKWKGQTGTSGEESMRRRHPCVRATPSAT